MKSQKSTIYFDGLCRVCSSEMDHYRKLVGAENFDFVDITHPDFNPQMHGLDPQQVHKVMHVRDANGELHQGVDAFRAIWKQIPKYHFLAKWSENSAIRAVMNVGYHAFAKLRPYLPRKKADCSTSPYCEANDD